MPEATGPLVVVGEVVVQPSCSATPTSLRLRAEPGAVEGREAVVPTGLAKVDIPAHTSPVRPEKTAIHGGEGTEEEAAQVAVVTLGAGRVGLYDQL